MSIDVSQFHQAYFEESFENLDIMESGLLGVDLGMADLEAINTIFRAAHSIKGGGGTFGFTEISEFTHVLETLLDEMRGGRREVTREAVDLLLQSVDCVREMLRAAQSDEDTDKDRIAAVHGDLERMLNDTAGADSADAAGDDDNGGNAPPACGWRIRFKPHPQMLRTGNDPLRMFRELATLGELEVQADLTALPTFAQLDPETSYIGWNLTLRGAIAREQVTEVFDWVEGDCDLEIMPLPDTAAIANQQARHKVVSPTSRTPLETVAPAEDRRTGKRRAGSDRRNGEQRVGGQGEITSIRVGIDKLDGIINLVGELVITQASLARYNREFDVSDVDSLRTSLAQLERNTRELQESVMRIRMLPIRFAFDRFSRLVHDLGAKLGKKVALELRGEQTELDKTVLEKISDPLVHLVRNALDHGLETPAVRLAAGKPEIGRLRLDAYHAGGEVVIAVTDDGAGLAREKILDQALQRGLVGAEEELSEAQIHRLIFRPGFSTADQVSDVSGRGVGMDVVRRNIKDLGGTVDVQSEQGKGTTFTIRLPLTLAILDGQLIRVGCEIYIISLLAIIESLQVEDKLVNKVAGQAEVYTVRGDFIPIIRLHEAFGLEHDSDDGDTKMLVIVEVEGQRVGLLVDELLDQQQVVIKSLEANYQRVEGLAAATILGDGAVALILDAPGLIRSFFQNGNLRYDKRTERATSKVA